MVTRPYWFFYNYVVHETNANFCVWFTNHQHYKREKNLVYLDRYRKKKRDFPITRQLYCMFIYEEGGDYFEFFTNRPLGRRDSQGRLCIPETFIHFDFNYFESDDYGASYEQASAAEFMAEIQEHMEYEQLVKNAVNAFFDYHHNLWVDAHRPPDLLKQEKIQDDAEKWLDKLIRRK